MYCFDKDNKCLCYLWKWKEGRNKGSKKKETLFCTALHSRRNIEWSWNNKEQSRARITDMNTLHWILMRRYREIIFSICSRIQISTKWVFTSSWDFIILYTVCYSEYPLWRNRYIKVAHYDRFHGFSVSFLHWVFLTTFYFDQIPLREWSHDKKKAVSVPGNKIADTCVSYHCDQRLLHFR
jgi:hypothetical protein